MSDLTALAALLSLHGALGLDVASLSTTVAYHFAFVVAIGAATFVAVTSTRAVTAAASTTAATAAAPASSRVLVSPPISPGVRSMSLVCLGLRTVTLTCLELRSPLWFAIITVDVAQLRLQSFQIWLVGDDREEVILFKELVPLS